MVCDGRCKKDRWPKTIDVAVLALFCAGQRRALLSSDGLHMDGRRCPQLTNIFFRRATPAVAKKRRQAPL